MTSAADVVCVVGAGTAGLEGLFAAREQLGARTRLRLIAPPDEFRYRPMSAGSLFRPASERGLSIAELAANARAAWTADRADVVRLDDRTVLTGEGDIVGFDFLLLAPGARSMRTLRQGFVWERGGDPGVLDRILAEIRAGEIRSVAVVVPRGARWPVPVYELALVLAWTAARTDTRVTLLSAEQAPLGALGTGATETVTRELDEAGVEVVGGVEVLEQPHQAAGSSPPIRLALRAEDPAAPSPAPTGRSGDPTAGRARASETREFDRLISLPAAFGPRIAGVPTDAAGFIQVDEALRVCGAERVWAVGSCIASALDHTLLAARQADAAVGAIAAARTGAAAPTPPDLIGILLHGQRKSWQAENPPGTIQPSTRCLWWPPGRAVGRLLAARIAAWDASVEHALPARPGGLVVHVPIALRCGEHAATRRQGAVSDEVRAARMREIENRQLLAVRRREREADALLQALSSDLEALAARERATIQELRQHGYLRDRQP